MEQLGWTFHRPHLPILQVPLHFSFPPVEVISKELTKLNSQSAYRILYLGPRWPHSTIFHKVYSQKHGYPFQINMAHKNNTFWAETMTRNQFYRNEMYYRAFEGNNPTMEEGELIFESRFESGNLDCVVKVGKDEYDLFLRIDSNTRGHLFWYYFSVANADIGQTVQFNICNLTKKKSLYHQNLKPYVFVDEGWTQHPTTNVTYEERKLRYEFIYEKMKVRKFYTLSFQYTFLNHKAVCFSYCIPYTYTHLQADLHLISQQAEIKILGKSLTGVDIPIVKIGKDQKEGRKQVIVITGRIHPGEPNGSYIIAGLMKSLCLSSEAQYLRKKCIFIIVPMLNPDGVIIGNSRTGASGRDLNRQFRTLNSCLYPEVTLIKQLVKAISRTHEIELYFDFHGHSRKKNMFLYGPPYSITQSEYYKCRLIPKLISLATPIFRYFSCSYTIPQSKKATARAVMIEEYRIPYVYTMECSIGFYHDFIVRKDVAFQQKVWQCQGEAIISAIKQYKEGIQQYNNFVQFRRNRKMSPSKTATKSKTELQIVKLFEEIKNIEHRKNKQINDLSSHASSDSHNHSEDLEEQQITEFETMVSNYRETQSYSFKPIKIQPPRQNYMMKRKPTKISKHQQMTLFNQFLIDVKSNHPTSVELLSQRKGAQSHRYNRIKDQSKKQISQQHKLKTLKQLKAPFNNQTTFKPNIFQLQTPNHQIQQNINNSNHRSRLANSYQNSNVTIVNFSKMIQNPKSLQYQIQLNSYQSLEHHKSDAIYPAVINSVKINKFTLFESQILNKNDNPLDLNKGNNYQKITNYKNPFPTSFYRIKYQSGQKNRKNSCKRVDLSNNQTIKDQKKPVFLSIHKLKNK